MAGLLKRGVLTRLDVAFSRDQPEKRYVQHALWDARRDLYAWLQDGAALYVCGDANAMAKDVHATLQRILADRAARMAWRRSTHCGATAAICAMSTEEANDGYRTAASPNEAIKANSRFLRGTIADGLTHVETGALADDDQQLTKFHGIYLQDDRDLRAERGRKKMEKAFIFMARMRVPGGMLTPAQWLAARTIARRARQRHAAADHAPDHPVSRHHQEQPAPRDPAAMNDAMLDTIAACGDVNRNVIATVNPWQSGAHAEVAALAQAIGAHLLPKSRAWHEIWIDGEKQISGGEEEDEPIYGRTYMPRKFKIAIALPPHNDVDVFAHDLGFIAIEEGGRIVGYNVVVGGGMGMTHGEPDTFPRTGDVIGFCRPDQAVDVAEKVVTVQRDFGDRSDRKHARLKYTIERMGLAAFRAELERRLGYALSPARDFAFTDNGDRLGWAQGDDGTWHFTLFVENGRRARSCRSACDRRTRHRPFHHHAEPESCAGGHPGRSQAGSGCVAAFAWPRWSGERFAA